MMARTVVNRLKQGYEQNEEKKLKGSGTVFPEQFIADLAYHEFPYNNRLVNRRVDIGSSFVERNVE